MEIDSALTAIQTLRSELQDAKMAAVSEQLKPLPGESVSKVQELMDSLCLNPSLKKTKQKKTLLKSHSKTDTACL